MFVSCMPFARFHLKREVRNLKLPVAVFIWISLSDWLCNPRWEWQAETISKNVDPLLCISVSMKKPYTEHQPESVQTCTHVFHFTADIGKDSSNLILRITRFSTCCNLNVLLNLGVTSPTPASPATKTRIGLYAVKWKKIILYTQFKIWIHVKTFKQMS